MSVERFGAFHCAKARFSLSEKFFEGEKISKIEKNIKKRKKKSEKIKEILEWKCVGECMLASLSFCAKCGILSFFQKDLTAF